MATHLRRSEDELLYFVTFTCYKWLPLFEITNTYSEVYKWFKIIEQRGARIVGFVIMPNHVHCLIYISRGGEKLNRIVANGKRFMAYEIVKRLKSQSREDILSILHMGVQDNERLKGKKHKVFRLSFDSIICQDDEMPSSILHYVHANPVNGKWQLVTDYLNYEHSSARFYEVDKPHIHCDILHFRD